MKSRLREHDEASALSDESDFRVGLRSTVGDHIFRDISEDELIVFSVATEDWLAARAVLLL